MVSKCMFFHTPFNETLLIVVLVLKANILMLYLGLFTCMISVGVRKTQTLTCIKLCKDNYRAADSDCFA